MGRAVQKTPRYRPKPSRTLRRSRKAADRAAGAGNYQGAESAKTARRGEEIEGRIDADKPDVLNDGAEDYHASGTPRFPSEAKDMFLWGFRQGYTKHPSGGLV